MSFKKILVSALFVLSFGAHAIPPAPPSSMFNKFKAIAARNCITETDILVSEFKDTDKVKFVLELDKDAAGGVLITMENGVKIDSLKVTCR